MIWRLSPARPPPRRNRASRRSIFPARRPKTSSGSGGGCWPLRLSLSWPNSALRTEPPSKNPMPTLLEKPSPVASPACSPVEVLHSRHRWERWRGVLIILLIGLAATLAALVLLHPSWHTPADGKILAAVWTGGCLLTLAAAAMAWRFAPASLADTAQGMDRNLAAKNRLEAA